MWNLPNLSIFIPVSYHYFLSLCICTSVGTSEPCTSASRVADRRRIIDASTGPWCTSMPMSTYSVYWRRFWRALHSWCSNSVSWSRRTGPKRCSVRSASGLYTETVDICEQHCLFVTDVNEYANVTGKTQEIWLSVEIFTHHVFFVFRDCGVAESNYGLFISLVRVVSNWLDLLCSSAGNLSYALHNQALLFPD